MPKERSRAGRVRLKPADSFDLIRLIARSQSDPRKAVAELVQNSLDAGAERVRLEWFTHEKERALSVVDDGLGVFPELAREEALRRIATTIGASHKKEFTPAERHEQMTLGKYGIGLLGFWSIGALMELRTRVAGSPVWVLRLREEGREAEVFQSRARRLPLENETFTEIVITGIHRPAVAQLNPRRLAGYLASELRGQLMMRKVSVEIHDRVARGRAQKRLLVQPLRFQGIPLGDLRELPVPGQVSARIDLYLVPESESRHGRVSLSCGGATVLDDIGTLDGGETTRSPWDTGRFEGVVDFAGLEVAPSTRRGFVPNEAALDFLSAVRDLEARLEQVLAEDADRRSREQDAHDARRLRKLFRSIARELPQYVFFEVEGRGGGGDRAGEGAPASGASGEVADGAASGPDGLPLGTLAPEPERDEADDAEADELEPQAALFPPGPLASVDLRPRRSRLVPRGERKLHARAHDAAGRRIREGVEFGWRIDGPGELVGEGAAPTYRAPAESGHAKVHVEARQADTRVSATADVRVSDELEGGGARGGIPDPQPVSAPAESWRSRVLPGRWEYNVAHADYRLVQDEARLRLRYLAQLFAKEVVLRNFGDPSDAELLERMVEVLVRLGDAPPRRSGR